MGSEAEFDVAQSLQILNDEFARLQTELLGMQSGYQDLSKHYGTLCTSRLQDSLDSLFKIIRYVNRADKSLIDWHGRSDGLKTALRLVGIDRRTNALVEKKTQKMKTKVSKVEAKVDLTENAVSESLQSMSFLSEKVVAFSVSSVEQASDQVDSTRNLYNKANGGLKESIRESILVNNEAQESVTQVTTSIDQLKIEQDSTRFRRDLSTGATMLGAVATAASIAGAFVFLPSAALTVPLLAATRASAMNGLEHSAELTKLEAEESRMNAELAESQAKLDELQHQLSLLRDKHTDLASAIAEAESLQSSTGNLKTGAQAILDDMRAVRCKLNDIRAMLKAVSRELHECGYAETRKEIAARLHGTLLMIQDVGSRRNMELNSAGIRDALKAVKGMSNKTPQIMRIIEISAQ